MYVLAGAALILDSRCAAQSVRGAMELCTGSLIPSLFPLLVISTLLVPMLRSAGLAPLARLIGVPRGGEGIWLLGALGGFPVGASCIAQSVRSGALTERAGTRMLGLCSLCGPAFLFGVLPRILPMAQVIALFVLQLETSLLLAAFWPGPCGGELSSTPEPVTAAQAVRRAIDSMLSICGWVTVAAVAAGFLRRWLFPLLPELWGVVLTGLLELTGGIFSLPERNRFVLCALFVCFGSVSVLLQIGGLAADAGLSMGTCVLQKTLHGLLGLLGAFGYLHWGWGVFLLIPAILFGKITVEIPAGVMYNVRERKGSKCCFAKKWSSPASTAASARK